jgi:putative pyruvate formate lyase activating enzyme
VFFAGCSVGCVFCQNHQISRSEAVASCRPKTAGELAGIFLRLEEEGCHNINWVTPGHVLPIAVEALFLADRRGLQLPVVYNTSGYDRVETLKLLDGIVDIYLPDHKYGEAAPLDRLCGVSDYPAVARPALQEMWRQAGPLMLGPNGIAQRGVTVRHLVLPADLADTHNALAFVARELGPEVSVSLMAQYTPAVQGLLPPLDRPLTAREYEEAVGHLEMLGLPEGWVQELDASKCFTPDFTRDEPFRTVPSTGDA